MSSAKANVGDGSNVSTVHIIGVTLLMGKLWKRQFSKICASLRENSMWVSGAPMQQLRIICIPQEGQGVRRMSAAPAHSDNLEARIASSQILLQLPEIWKNIKK